MTSLADFVPAGARAQFVARISGNTRLCREHYQLLLRVDAGFPLTDAGQFIQIACRDDLAMTETAGEWVEDERGRFLRTNGPDLDLDHPNAILRRPFSLAGRADLQQGAVELEIIHRVVGVGTDWMSHLRAGDSVNILGPLGIRFTLPRENETALLVGGGVGIPPMLYLAATLASRGIKSI